MKKGMLLTLSILLFGCVVINTVGSPTILDLRVGSGGTSAHILCCPGVYLKDSTRAIKLKVFGVEDTVHLIERPVEVDTVSRGDLGQRLDLVEELPLKADDPSLQIAQHSADLVTLFVLQTDGASMLHDQLGGVERRKERIVWGRLLFLSQHRLRGPSP